MVLVLHAQVLKLIQFLVHGPIGPIVQNSVMEVFDLEPVQSGLQLNYKRQNVLLETIQFFIKKKFATKSVVVAVVKLLSHFVP